MNNISKYKSGIINIEIQSAKPESFVNLLWKNKVIVKNIRKISITTIAAEVKLRDYEVIDKLAKKTKTKIKITDRKGIAFYLIRARKKITLSGGIILFVLILYYLSTYIWGIDINSDKNIAPYDIRQQLYSIGVKPGIKKSSIDVKTIEEKMNDLNENIMWVKVRMEGSKLVVSVAERKSPPSVVNDTEPCNLISSKDGQVVRVYTVAGTAVVKQGDIIKKGQLLVKGEQGKEGTITPVHSKGDVIAKTFYEQTINVPFQGIKNERTGKYVESSYIMVGNKKIYLKKSVNKFQNYDKIIDDKHFIKKEVYYEVKPKEFKLDTDKVIEETLNKLNDEILLKINKSVKVVDKIVDTKIDGDNCIVRLVIVAEENVAIPENLDQQR